MNRKSRTSCLALLSALLAAGVMLPPELQPVGLALEAILAALLMAALAWEDPASLDPAGWGIWLIAGLALLPALLASFQVHTSLALVFHLVPAAAVLVASRRLSRFRWGREAIERTLVGLSGAAALWGVFQSLYSLPRTARYLRGLDNRELDPMILRAESGRAFGPFLLPADLGIFLAMALPLTLAWLWSAKSRGQRAAVCLILAAQVAGLAASRSYGGALSLLAAALLLVPLSRIHGKRRLGWALAAAGFVCAAGLFMLRGSEGVSPLRLRLENWGLAWKVFESHPFFGAGPGNLGDAMTAFQRPQMNETVYAHNSYLQVAAEGGMAAAALMMAALGALLAGMGRGLRKDADARDRLLSCLPAAAFLIHNLFDFSVYLPSLLLPFAALCALAMRPPGPHPERVIAGRRKVLFGGAALGIVLGGLVFWGVRESRTEALLQSARWDLQEGRLETAREAARSAARLNSGHPDAPALLSEMALVQAGESPAADEEGERWARRAVALRPHRAYGHYVLSLYRLAKGDLGESFLELARARRLFPRRETYRTQEARLREMIASSPAPSPAADGK